MAGYRRDKTYRLVFEPGEFDGLEVRLRSIPIGEYQRLLGFLEDQPGDRAEALRNDMEVQGIFCASLIEWNLEDRDGNPTPLTVDGLRSHDLDLVQAMVTAWYTELAGIPAPLPEASGNGQLFPGASMPMELLPPSLAS